METVNIGIIGGSGLYQMPELQNIREIPVNTPFGPPSDLFIVGELDGITVAFLPRHGRGHKILPTDLPFRANMYAMKLLGVEYILLNGGGTQRDNLRRFAREVMPAFAEEPRIRAVG